MKMRIVVTCQSCLALLALSAIAVYAQAPTGYSDDLELGLIGNRFRPLAHAEMTDAQRAMVRNILDGPRDAVRGPFNVLLRAPEMGDLAQALGAYVRFQSSLSATLREMAIIMTAAYWRAEYEWYAHKNAALSVGLDPAIVAAIAGRRRPPGMNAAEAALYDFCAELLNDHRIDDDTYATALAELGEQGLVEVIGTVGYYSLVSMALNVDEYPLPDGVEPEFALGR